MQQQLPKNFPFYDWVPKPLGIIFLVALFIPIMTVSGAYSANSSEMVGGLGILSEHISFIGFVTSVGMAAFSPFFYTLVCVRRQKLMCVAGFSLLAMRPSNSSADGNEIDLIWSSWWARTALISFSPAPACFISR